jgi:prevent-host-death family protein
MVTVISATAAKQRFAALLDAAQRGPVRIQRHERDVAVLVSPGDYELLRQIRAQELTQLADKMSRYAASQGMTDEELQKRMAVGGEASSDGPVSAGKDESVKDALARGSFIREQAQQQRIAANPEVVLRQNHERFAEFNRLVESAAQQARSNGLTEELLAEILAER